jgi:hypothetical protein
VSDEAGSFRSPSYRVNRSHGLDPMTRRLMLIAGGLTAALVVIALLWSSAGHRGGEVPVVQADPRPLRVKPANPGGMQISGLSADVSSRADGSSGTLAPAPETPDPQALAQPAPPPAPKMVPTVVPALPPPPAIKAAAVAPAPAAPDRRPAAPAASSAAAGRREVQLAALTSEAAARQEWDHLVHQMPGLFANRQPIMTRIDHDGHTLWRLRTGGFATESAAGQFCQQVRAKGAGCAVAAF